MKQKDLDKSAACRIILATFAMAAEGFNVPTLNTVLLATPKSAVEQSVGRILRQRPEERAVAPLILDVLDAPFAECHGQWRKRAKFYKSCGYAITWHGEETSPASQPIEDAEDSNKGTGACLIQDKDCCDSVCPECMDASAF
jgi:superfamily II DNA or RNA helicase